MICKYCRDRCKRGLDCTQYINISDTDIKCHPATPFCPDWLFKEKT